MKLKPGLSASYNNWPGNEVDLHVFHSPGNTRGNWTVEAICLTDLMDLQNEKKAYVLVQSVK